MRKKKVIVQPDRPAKSLSILDVIKVRNELKKKKKYKLLFAFEMFYTHGVKLNEIEQFGDNSYSSSQNIFTFYTDERKKDIRLSRFIAELIENHPDLLIPKRRGTYAISMQKLSTVIKFVDRDKVVLDDIEKTRENYFPTCPMCKEKYPNSDEFWALVQFEEDTCERGWLYCRNCTEKMRGDKKG